MATIFRGGVCTVVSPRRVISCYLPPNTLIRGIPAGPSPVQNLQQPQVFLKRLTGQVSIPPNTLLLGIPVGAVQTPFKNTLTFLTIAREVNSLEIAPNNLINGYPLPDMPASNDTITQMFVRRVLKVEQPPNLLLSTLAQVAPPSSPFSQTNWPSVIKTEYISSDLFPNLLASTLRTTSSITLTPSGGIQFAGTATPLRIMVPSVSGGLQFAGTYALFNRKTTLAPLGGLVFGGSGDFIGITIGGTVLASFRRFYGYIRRGR